MSGRLKKINLLLSQGDYAMIMTTLNENLGEVVEEPSKHCNVRTDRKSHSEPSKTTVCK